MSLCGIQNRNLQNSFADIYASINEHIQALRNNVKHKAGKGNVLTFVKVIEQNNSEFY